MLSMLTQADLRMSRGYKRFCWSCRSPDIAMTSVFPLPCVVLSLYPRSDIHSSQCKYHAHSFLVPENPCWQSWGNRVPKLYRETLISGDRTPHLQRSTQLALCLRIQGRAFSKWQLVNHFPSLLLFLVVFWWKQSLSLSEPNLDC